MAAVKAKAKARQLSLPLAPKSKSKSKAKAKAKAKAKIKAKAPAKPVVAVRKAPSRAFSPEEDQLLDAAAAEADGLLVYADWLETQSDVERATIVRLQYEILTRAVAADKPKGRWGETTVAR